MADEVSGNGSDDRSSKTDPSVLTTQQLIREMAGLKEMMLSIVQGNFSVIDTRLEGMDKAIELVRNGTAQFPEYVRERVNQLREFHGEKFNSVNTQFQEIEKRNTQLSTADKTAVAAALQAAKEAVGAQNTSNSAAIAKSESATVEAIKQLQTLFSTANAATNDKINDLKSRLDRGEGKTSISDPALAEAMKMMASSVANIQTTSDQTSGHTKGVEQSWAVIVAIASIAAVVIVSLIKFHS